MHWRFGVCSLSETTFPELFSAYVGISGLLFLLGILFLVGWVFRKQIREAPTKAT